MGGILTRGGGSRRHHHHHRDHFIGRTIPIHGKSYTFQRRLGAGAFGVVYAARSHHYGHVAIKVIDISGMPEYGPQLVESYLNEVKRLQGLRQESRHVVVIHDFDFDARSGRAYIVMELGGENLRTLIHRVSSLGRSRGGPGTHIQPVLRKEVWRQLVSIVSTLHANNIVHMDLKPDNIILFGRTLKIADLGISKKANMLHHAGVGTPLFSAPEIMMDFPGSRRVYGPKADIWSLGAILYLMTYGTPPGYHPHAAEPPHGQLPSGDPFLVDMLRRTLVLEPHARASISELARHPFTLR